MEFNLNQNTIKTTSTERLEKKQLKEIENSFYAGDAKSACKEQVELFFRNPTHLSLSFSRSNAPYIHQRFINQTYKVAVELGYKANSRPSQSTIVILGLGAGYHIPRLLQALNYTDVIVIEQDNVLEALGRQNLNFAELSDLCSQRSGNFEFVRCQNYQAFLNFIKAYVARRHCGILADISLYRHYNCELFDQIFEKFTEWRNSLVSMWGYFEDEIIGLRHTQENQESLKKFNSSDFKGLAKETALIVGNGPSLDLIINDIKGFKGLIVSCGTSLASLLKKEIVPHIHVEMERNEENHKLKEKYLTNPKLRNTILITLNTIHPDTIKAFKHKLVFFKGNDSAAELIKKENEIKPLYHCNPTVTNAAMSALVYLGVQDFVLSGCDFGFINEEAHHSTHSQYYNSDDTLSRAKFKGSFYVTGNQTARVLTTRIFNESRSAIESLIARHPSLKVRNISQGALIRGATPTTMLSETTKVFNDAILKQELKVVEKSPSIKMNLSKNKINLINLIESLYSEIERANDFNSTVNCIEELINQLESNKQEKYAMVLLSGSLKYILFSIFSQTNHINNRMKENYIRKIKGVIKSTINDFKVEIISLNKDRK